MAVGPTRIPKCVLESSSLQEESSLSRSNFIQSFLFGMVSKAVLPAVLLLSVVASGVAAPLVRFRAASNGSAVGCGRAPINLVSVATGDISLMGEKGRGRNRRRGRRTQLDARPRSASTTDRPPPPPSSSPPTWVQCHIRTFTTFTAERLRKLLPAAYVCLLGVLAVAGMAALLSLCVATALACVLSPAVVAASGDAAAALGLAAAFAVACALLRSAGFCDGRARRHGHPAPKQGQ